MKDTSAEWQTYVQFEPICYDHAARLIDRRPWDVSRDAELLASAHLEAMKTYGYDRCIVGLDIYNIEAEAYGCDIVEPGEDGVPVVGNPVLSDMKDFMSLKLDSSRDGRIPLVLEAAQRIAAKHPDAEIRIPLSGPFTIACHLVGMENAICELSVNPESTAEALMHLAGNQVQYGHAATGMGFGITLLESSVTPPLLSPKLFADYVVPSLNRILSDLNDHASSGCQLIIGGDTVHILDAILSLPAGYIICPVETEQQQFMSRLADNRQATVRINMNPSVFLPGNDDAAIIEAQRVFDMADRNPNTTMGTLIPFEADPQIVNSVSGFIQCRQQADAPAPCPGS